MRFALTKTWTITNNIIHFDIIYNFSRVNKFEQTPNRDKQVNNIPILA